MVAVNESNFPPEVVALLCVEFWKLAQSSSRAIEIVPDGKARKLAGQVKFSKRQLTTLMDQLGLNLVEFEGEEFHSGLSASADNAEDYDDDTALIVTKTLEPTIMQDMSIVRTGRVLVEPKE